jgi:hypothetical protein
MPELHKPQLRANVPDDLQCIEKAQQLTLHWVQQHNIRLREIDLVTPSIQISKKFSVWLFYTTDAEMQQNEVSGNTQRIKDQYMAYLRELKCPEEYIGGVIFFVDSDENVKRFAALKPIDS